MATPSSTQASRERTTRRKPALSSSALRILIFLLVSGACFIGASNQGIAAETSTSKEHQIKAAFVYNFTKFVEWSPNSFDGPSAPLILAVAGKGPQAAELEAVVKDRTVNGRKLVVRAVESPEAARGAHVLFLPASEDSRLAEWLDAVRDPGILTVGESGAFTRADGMISFVLEGDKVRFEINVVAAEQAGLKISSQLLKLAKTVRKQKQE